MIGELINQIQEKAVGWYKGIVNIREADLVDILDKVAKEFREVCKDETRLDEVPLLVKKWFGDEE